MSKYVIWGTGDVANYCYEMVQISRLLKKNSILAFVDSDRNKRGKFFREEYKIVTPEDLDYLDYDFIDIWSADYRDEIKEQIVNSNLINKNIRDYFSPIKNILLDKYKNSEDYEIQELLCNLQMYPRPRVYNYDFKEPHKDLQAFYDENIGLHYVVFEGKRMYLSKSFQDYYWKDDKCWIHGNMWYEQDDNSPHKYEDDSCCVTTGDILVDVGTCEGNFTLHHIDTISKAYLFEGDPDWVEALRYTFAPYSNKVTIIEKYVGNQDTNEYTSLDSVIQEKINFIKMDIEGAEYQALLGGKRTFTQNPDLKCAICTYHKSEDAELFYNTFLEWGYDVHYSKGYMLPLWEPWVVNEEYEFRRGVLRARKGAD